jgi:hypothetical protein
MLRSRERQCIRADAECRACESVRTEIRVLEREYKRVRLEGRRTRRHGDSDWRLARVGVLVPQVEE